MTDSAVTDAPLQPDVFDVAAWLDDTSYSGKKVEVFNRGQQLADLAELLEFIEARTAEKEQQSRQLTKPIAPKSIADDAEPEIDQLISDAQSQADAILESLKGTGATFYVQGVAPEVRRVMEEKIERSLKPVAAVYEGEGDERVQVEPPVLAGRQHPKFNETLEFELIARSIQKVEQGGKITDKKWTPEEVGALKGKLHGPEYRRLANATFDVNFFAYDIDSKVTLDF